ncbi:MAG: radical SAM protein [Candidatus Methanoperedens sp.]|nr:radical SAM protein [Candidatus Methanoperedens sp.]
MKISLILPPRPYLFEQKSFPYLGVLVVSSALKKAGHDIKVFDFADGYKYSRSDFYGIYSTNADFSEAKKIRDFIRSYENGAKIMIGGPMATYSPQECLKEFEYVAMGDGEISAYEIIKHKTKGIHIGHLDNIDLYHPDRTALNLHDYKFYVDKKLATSMVTSYSCAYGKCAFCSRPPSPFNRVRFHSVDWCKDEIDDVVKFGFKAIMIYDDEFFTNPKRDKDIVDYLGESIEAWRCFVRTDYTLRNKELIERAAKNNLKEVLIGIESGSNTVLSAIDKGCTSSQNFLSVKLLSNCGIKVKCAMIIGLPSESEKTLKETWEWCEKAEPYVTDWDFTTFTPLPSSDIYESTYSYDIQFDKKCTFVPYKAMNMKSEICPIRTKDLTYGEICEARKNLEDRFKLKKGGG